MDIQLTQILFQIVNFGVVLGVLWFLLYKPVLKIFAERAKRIEEGQKAASKALEHQEQIAEIKQKTEGEARKKANQMIKDATGEAEKQKEEILAKARETAIAEVAKMKDAWKSEKEQIIQQIRIDGISAVIKTSEKVIGASLDKKAHAQLIDTELESVLKSI
ncbi:ATP synthase F0 subunit B [Candidatus Woesebacteria bacterium]|nr:ATP synthase F0 subunit B [Candidatus Woesebacteria bacterium]